VLVIGDVLERIKARHLVPNARVKDFRNLLGHGSSLLLHRLRIFPELTFLNTRPRAIDPFTNFICMSNEPEDSLFYHEDRIRRLLNEAIKSGNHEGILRYGEELFNVSIAPGGSRRTRHRHRQLRYFPPGWSFGALPANWFRTMAGGLLFQARNELGLSQKEFSKLVGTAPATISRIENGLQDPSLGTLLKILYRCGFRLEADLAPIL
jgi:DNA-binding XRE family transcriptional regulator